MSSDHDRGHERTAAGLASSPDVTTTRAAGASEEESLDRIESLVRQRLFTRETAVTRIGRFVILEQVGTGGMGSVYAAYDERLDRKVAIKILHDWSHDRQSRQRFLREAQAMAHVSHPNVVTVHEAGEDDGEVFLAMEFIRGQTVGAWCKAEPGPGWREILDAYVQAGRGLAAAHEAGLVHRDLKPHNIMRSEGGLVKVLDFGLARAMDDDAEDTADIPETSGSMLASSLTRTGALMGTPAYMAPEQMRDGVSDARSDQFSFCVALFEALYGQRPFEGSTLRELAAAMEHDEVRPAPRGSAVPLGVRKVLLRGLARDPDHRWPSMAALLEPLSARVAPRQVRWIGPAVVVGALALGAGVVLSRYATESQRCTGASIHLQGVWDDDRRQQIRDAILGTELAYASDTWSRVEQGLDEYAAAWTEGHTQACEATSVRREQSEEHMDLRMGCLRQRRQHLRSAVDELARADDAVVERAVSAVADLPRISRCAEVDALAAEVPLPEDPEVAAGVADLEERLAVVGAKQKAGRYREGLELVEAMIAEAEALDYAPLVARTWLSRAMLEYDAGHLEPAVESLRRAYALALADGLLVEASRAASDMVCKLGVRLGRHDEAHQWVTHAQPLSLAVRRHALRMRYLQCSGGLAFSEGKFERARKDIEDALALWDQMPDASRLKKASYLNNLGIIARSQGRYVEARGASQQVLDIWEDALGPRHPDVALALDNLGALAHSEGKSDEAQQLMERALAIREEVLGPEHPNVALSLTNVGAFAGEHGDYERAHRLMERALAIRTKTLGPDHHEVATTLANLAGIDALHDEFESAREFYERALVIRERALGPDHTTVGDLLTEIANLDRMQGNLQQARATGMRALSIQESALGPEHDDVARVLLSLGKTARAAGKLGEARRWFERARAVWEGGAVPDARLALITSLDLGKTLLELGEPAQARVVLEQTLKRCTERDVRANMEPELRFVLARALWDAPADAGRDRARARALVERAIEDAPLDERLDVAALERWLVEHPAG